MTLSFAAIGVFLGALGPALGVDSSTVRTEGAAMMIAFALISWVQRESPSSPGQTSAWKHGRSLGCRTPGSISQWASEL